MNVISVDHKAATAETNAANQAARFYQSVLDTVCVVLSVENFKKLQRIVNGTVDTFYDMVASELETKELDGIQVSPKKQLQLIDLPDAETLKHRIHKARSYADYSEYLELVPTEQLVKVRDSAHDEIKAMHSVCAETELEEDLLDALASAAQSLTRLQTESERAGIPLVQFLKNAPPKDAFFNFFRLNDEGGFEINEQIFKDIKSGFQFHIPRRSWR